MFDSYSKFTIQNVNWRKDYRAYSAGGEDIHAASVSNVCDYDGEQEEIIFKTV